MDEPQPLSGVRVIDLTQALAGPYCAQLLGDLGADVVKVERPPSGDQSRGWGPPFLEGESAYFLSTNRNKRGVALDLKRPAGRAALHRLLERADVFLVNLYRPEQLRGYGLEVEAWRERNPRLVYATITGFGMDGPLAGRPGYDILAQAMSGMMSMTGPPEGDPYRYPVPIADLTCGIYTAMGVLAALLRRERTGRGAYLDMALLDSQMSWLSILAGSAFATGWPPPKLGNAHGNIVPYQPFRARDKWIIAGVGSETLWGRFCRALELGAEVRDDPRFARNPDRVRHREALLQLLEPIFLERDAAQWLALFEAEEIPAAPINLVDEALAQPQALHRGVIVELEHPLIGSVRSLGNPIHDSEGAVTYRLPPPTLGQHTEEVLRQAGFSASKLEAMRASGAIA